MGCIRNKKILGGANILTSKLNRNIRVKFDNLKSLDASSIYV